MDVSTINQFKARLDKFWMQQDVLYDYTADMTGTGDRSVLYVVMLNSLDADIEVFTPASIIAR